MRLIVTFFLVLISSKYITAQYIQVAPSGFEYQQNKEKNYHIIDVEGKTAKELYENAIKYIHKNYVSPDDVIKGNIENEYISISTYIENISKLLVLGWVNVEARTMVSLEFKDNKVKFEIESFDMWWLHNNQGRIDKKEILINTNGKFVWGIFNKKGRYTSDSMETTKRGVDIYFNKMIDNFIKGLKGEKDDDW